MTRIAFPDGFIWGAATSSQQIEGATTEGPVRTDQLWRLSLTRSRMWQVEPDRRTEPDVSGG